MIDVACKVDIMETDGKQTDWGQTDTPVLEVNSHSNRRGMIVLQFGETALTVLGEDLQAAIKNAENTNFRW